MTIDDDTRATIVRLFRIEGWPVGTIARELGLHHSTVTRTLQQAAGAPQERPPRPSMIDPYLPFVRQTLQSWPELHASRLYQMVCERGYRGGPDHFRHLIVPLRPRRPAEAYLRLRFLPGEQAQVDWADFGTVTIGRAERKLMGFVMTLSHSRHMILQYFLDAQMSNFLRGHVAAFRAFGGVPRVLLYDNLKSVVLKRHGATVVFNPNFIPFFRHYGFEPRAAAPRRGSDKGRVERGIRFVRSSFFAARSWRDVADLNAQAALWSEGHAADRPWPDDRTRRVRAVFAEEQPYLIALPDTDYPVDDLIPVKIGKTPYARFDGNDYTVPHTHVRRVLTVSASLTTVRILDGDVVLASHARSFDKDAPIDRGSGTSRGPGDVEARRPAGPEPAPADRRGAVGRAPACRGGRARRQHRHDRRRPDAPARQLWRAGARACGHRGAGARRAPSQCGAARPDPGPHDATALAGTAHQSAAARDHGAGP